MSFTRKILATVVLIGSLSAASAASVDIPSGKYRLDPRHSNLLWSVNHFGFSTYYARFSTIDATLELDSEDIANSRLNVTVDPKSVDTNYPEEPNPFNEEIAGEKFFHAQEHPEITFTSTAIEITGEKTGKVTGNVTWRGITKPVTLDVTLNKAGSHPFTKEPMIGFSATGIIKRTDFGVDMLAGPISDEVTLTIEAEFAPEA